jgi:glycosyltransferase involved in cell wall biosynthesis
VEFRYLYSMKTLCIMDFVSRANGGIFEAERRLQQALQGQADMNVQVVGLRDPHTEADRSAWLPLKPMAYRVRGPQAFGYASEYFDTLLKINADLAYCAGLWKYPSMAALRWVRRTGKPMLVAPHGMLNPWGIRHSAIKKRIAGWLYQNAHLRHATCVRALCAAEADAIRDFGVKTPIAIIPNGVDPAHSGDRQALGGIPPWSGFIEPERKVLLFLSRVHPKKGLVHLLLAWKSVLNAQPSVRNTWALAIAGWDQGGHEAELKKLATELEIPWTDVRSAEHQAVNFGHPIFHSTASLLFLGPQFNGGKAACYRNCDAFILPSFSEGLPMVILEAWAYGKPVLMTAECNLPEGFSVGCALRIETNPESISECLGNFFTSSDAKLYEMGLLGFDLIKRNFTWNTVAAQMRSVYDWMLGYGPTPGCVRFFGEDNAI